MDGDHKAFIVFGVLDKEHARNIVPPLYRSDAKTIDLDIFSSEDLYNPVRFHKE